MQWLKYSKKEICELCTHKYSFQPSKSPFKEELLIYIAAANTLSNLCTIMNHSVFYACKKYTMIRTVKGVQKLFVAYGTNRIAWTVTVRRK